MDCDKTTEKWIVLPFHPAWQGARFSSALAKLNTAASVHQLASVVQADGLVIPRVRVAWKNELRSLSELIVGVNSQGGW